MLRCQACVRAKPETVSRMRSCSLIEHRRYGRLLVCRGHTDDGAICWFDVEMDQQLASADCLDFLQQDCPAELPSWSLNEDVLGDFHEFLDVVQSSEASQSDPIASGVERRNTSTTQDPANELSISRMKPPRQLSTSRRQRQNQQAQQRYRQRQRVTAFLTIPSSTALTIWPALTIVNCTCFGAFDH